MRSPETIWVVDRLNIIWGRGLLSLTMQNQKSMFEFLQNLLMDRVTYLVSSHILTTRNNDALFAFLHVRLTSDVVKHGLALTRGRLADKTERQIEASISGRKAAIKSAKN